MAKEILSYACRHPRAQDTIEGIARWWLLEHRIESIVGEVRRAQLELAAAGFMLERSGPDGRVHYRLNAERLEEILAWLGPEPGSDPDEAEPLPPIDRRLGGG